LPLPLPLPLPSPWSMVVAAPIVGATKPHHLTDASLRSMCI
jgi:hypothetical protein